MSVSLMKSTDLPKEFWDILGIDPAFIERLVITIERDRAILVEIDQLLRNPFSE